MEVKVEIIPERDSWNSYPVPLLFILRGEYIELDAGGRILVFSKDDIENLVKVADLTVR